MCRLESLRISAFQRKLVAGSCDCCVVVCVLDTIERSTLRAHPSAVHNRERETQETPRALVVHSYGSVVHALRWLQKLGRIRRRGVCCVFVVIRTYRRPPAYILYVQIKK